MQYVVKDLDDLEIGRANDARSTWQLIEARWPDAYACPFCGPSFRGWVKLSQHLQEGEALIYWNGRPVGGVSADGDE